jgi:flagellar secretion chaperone FliS
MYAASAPASPFNRTVRTMPQASLYASIGVETSVSGATPHQLVSMLFEGFVQAIAQAKGALQSGQIEIKGRAIGRAARIVDEGLSASLDLQGGGSLAADLADLYAYITLRLTQANLRNDARALDECLALMQPVRQAWAEIAPQVDRTRP